MQGGEPDVCAQNSFLAPAAAQTKFRYTWLSGGENPMTVGSWPFDILGHGREWPGSLAGGMALDAVSHCLC